MDAPTPHNISAIALAWHPTSGLLAVANLDGQVVVWSATDEFVVARRATDGLINSLAWSPDGTAVAIGTSDETITIWQPATDDASTLPDHGSEKRLELQLAWSSTGVLAAATWDRQIRLWDVATGTITHQFEGHEWSRQIAWSPDGALLACANYDDAAVVWDPFTGSIVDFLDPGDHSLSSLAWSPNGDQIALAGLNLRLWSSEGQPGSPRSSAVIVDGLKSPPAVAWSPDGTRVATTEYGTTRVWDPTNGAKVAEFVGFFSDMPTIAYSADGTMLAFANASEPRVWHSTTGTVSTLTDPAASAAEGG